MSHKTFLLLLYCGIASGFLEFPINTKSKDSVEKQSFKQKTQQHGEVTIWPSAACGQRRTVYNWLETGQKAMYTEFLCKPMPNAIYAFSPTVVGRIDELSRATCPQASVIECETRGKAEEICKPDTVKPFTLASKLKTDKDRIFTTQPSCHANFAEADKITARFVNQSPSMKKFRKLGDGGRDLITGSNDDIVVRSKAIPNTEITASNEFDYLPGNQTYSYNEAVKCKSSCKYGKNHVFKRDANAKFEFAIYPTSKCNWARLCLKATFTPKKISCDGGLKNAVVFLFKNGMVFSGLHKAGYVLPLLHSDPFSRIQIGRSEDHLEITTGMRERIILYGQNTGDVWLQTNSEECWGNYIEISNGTVVDPTDKSKVETKEKEDEKKTDIITAKPEVPQPTVSSITPPDIDFTTPPTEAPPAPSNAEDNRVSGTSVGDEDSQYEGWLTWAIFYGFLAGTGAGFLICALIFYLARRSIYQDWYRGMYNRYHTDASGITADGVYGEDLTHFTVGATTAGDQGVSITTTPTGTTTGMSTTMTPSAMTPSESKETGTQMNNTMITM